MMTNSLLNSILCGCRNMNGPSSILFLTLNILYAMISENPHEIDEAWQQVPKASKREVEQKVNAIRSYFDNPRYILLMQGPAIWGLIVNVIKVACKIEGIPSRQKELCQFDSEEVVAFINDILARWSLRKEVYDACNTGTMDFQLLRVLMTADHLELDSMTLVVNFFSPEGPSEENAIPREVAHVVHLTRYDMPNSGTFHIQEG